LSVHAGKRSKNRGGPARPNPQKTGKGIKGKGIRILHNCGTRPKNCMFYAKRSLQESVFKKGKNEVLEVKIGRGKRESEPSSIQVGKKS